MARPATSESMRAHWADQDVRARRKAGIRRRRSIRRLKAKIAYATRPQATTIDPRLPAWERELEELRGA